MGNPICPECGKLMKTKILKTIVGEDGSGLSKFWVSKCGAKFRVGSEVIRKRGKILSENEIRKNLGLGPKPTKVGVTYANRRKQKFKAPMVKPTESTVVSSPIETKLPKEKLKAHTIRR
jgi:hypothetical protein